MTLQLKSTQDGHGYEVCVTEDEITECTFISSMHLIDEKEKQLRSAIKRQAFNSFIERKAESR